MDHIHLDTCQSTQTYLLERLRTASESNLLVSCDEQTNGFGRRGSDWEQLGKSLAISFSLVPNTVKSISALEIGCLICSFFKTEYKIDLKLKWPNDIITPDNKKCGGIIMNLIENNVLVVGVGLNLNGNTSKDYDFPAGSVFSETKNFNIKDFAYSLYLYILNNRLSCQNTIKKFNDLCFHQNIKVSIIDGKSIQSGIFTGIGQMGEAILNIDGEIKKFITGSLRITV